MSTRGRSSTPSSRKSGGRKTTSPSPARKKSSTSSTTITSSSSSSKATKDTSSQFHYEFGGPLGALAVTIGLPLVIFLLFYLCNDKICLENPLSFAWNKFLPSLSELYPTKEAVHMYIGWMLLHVVLERILPGEIVEGVELENGKRLKYTLSGHLQFWVVIFLMGHSVFNWDRSDWDWNGVYRLKSIMPLSLSQIYDHYVPLITVSIIGSALLSVYLYATSFLPGRLLAKGGDSGNVIYDFFIGRELNPRLLGIDLKEFCELRPGLIGWLVINLGMACKQYQRYRSVSFSMVLVCAFQGLYVWDALYMEKAILTTMDITTDGFGYMLAFGDLSWVPFIYSLQARYLVDHDPALPLWQIALVTVVHFTGLYIFRSANSEKDAFRRDPSAREVAHLSYLQTKRGTRLITSGWWGSARKINYTGDWLVTLSWCLLCGFSSPVPYFQAIYFLVLLVHRADRDDHMCSEKYGADWVAYKQRVPYLFVPGLW